MARDCLHAHSSTDLCTALRMPITFPLIRYVDAMRAVQVPRCCCLTAESAFQALTPEVQAARGRPPPTWPMIAFTLSLLRAAAEPAKGWRRPKNSESGLMQAALDRWSAYAGALPAPSGGVLEWTSEQVCATRFGAGVQPDFQQGVPPGCGHRVLGRCATRL